MIDDRIRKAMRGATEPSARLLGRIGVTPMMLTLTGLVLAVAAATAAANRAWHAALVLWLVSRIPDGLDGPLARASGGGTRLGGWADIAADVVAYGSFVVGCAIGQPDALVACLFLLFTYYVNGATLLALAAAKNAATVDNGEPGSRSDDRTIDLGREFAEGTETIVAHALMALMPDYIAAVAWTFAAMVSVTIALRLRTAVRVLR